MPTPVCFLLRWGPHNFFFLPCCITTHPYRDMLQFEKLTEQRGPKYVDNTEEAQELRKVMYSNLEGNEAAKIWSRLAGVASRLNLKQVEPSEQPFWIFWMAHSSKAIIQRVPDFLSAEEQGLLAKLNARYQDVLKQHMEALAPKVAAELENTQIAEAQAQSETRQQKRVVPTDSNDVRQADLSQLEEVDVKLAEVVVLLLYKDQCPYCEDFLPIWSQLQAAWQEEPRVKFLAHEKSSLGADVISKYKKTWPAVHVFHDGSHVMEIERKASARTVTSISKHIVEVLEGQDAQEFHQWCCSAPTSVVLLYRPTCGHSARFLPVWNETEQELATQDGLEFRKVDTDKAGNYAFVPKLMGESQGVPTINIYHHGELEKQYVGVQDNLKQLVLQHHRKHNTGGASRSSTSVPQLRKPPAEGVTALLVHANWCPACTSYMPTWERIKQEHGQAAGGNIQFMEIESEKQQELMSDMVQAFPTVQLYIDGSLVEADARMQLEEMLIALPQQQRDQAQNQGAPQDMPATFALMRGSPEKLSHVWAMIRCSGIPSFHMPESEESDVSIRDNTTTWNITNLNDAENALHKTGFKLASDDGLRCAKQMYETAVRQRKLAQ